MKKYQKEIIGIYLFFIGGFILISLFDYNIINNKDNFMGPVGGYISRVLISFIGIGAFMFPLILGLLGYFYFSGKEILSKNNLSYIYYFCSVSIWIPTLLGFLGDFFEDVFLAHYSGVIGNLISSLFINNVGYLCTGIILLLSILIINMILLK